jgi:predicted small secreted protein
MTKSRALILFVIAVFLLSFLAGCNASANAGVDTAQSGNDGPPPAGGTNTTSPTDQINDINIAGAWRSDIGSVTYFYEDGTGRTEGDDGIYEFTWRVVSLTDAAADSLRGYRVREHYRVLSVTAEDEGINWGGNFDVQMTDGWSAEGYILVLTFDDIQIPFDYALNTDGQDKLMLNTGPLGEILAPRPNLEIRLQWVTLTRESP